MNSEILIIMVEIDQLVTDRQPRLHRQITTSKHLLLALMTIIAAEFVTVKQPLIVSALARWCRGASNNDPSDTRVCQYTIRQRYGKQPLFYTQCVERSSCMAQARQNFVRRSDGDHPLNRCKGSRLMASRRFRPTSQCAFCMRMTKISSVDDNRIFSTSAANLFTDSVDGSDTVVLTTALESPWNYFASSNGSPYGQLFDLTQYN